MRRRVFTAITSGNRAIARCDRKTLMRRMDRAVGGCCCDQHPARTIVTMKRVINKASHATVAENVARLIAGVEARGVKLFTTIDHSGEARRDHPRDQPRVSATSVRP
jgi:hypothetical protein